MMLFVDYETTTVDVASNSNESIDCVDTQQNTCQSGVPNMCMYIQADVSLLLAVKTSIRCVL